MNKREWIVAKKLQVGSMGRKFAEWHYYKLIMKFEDPELHKENIIDMMTWKQWINNALRRTHGIFGEGIDYMFLDQESIRAYVQVASSDRDTFSSAVSTYTSDSELVGSPVYVLIEKESPDLMALDIGIDDQVWAKNALERNSE